MKKFLNYTLVLFAGLFLAVVSCSKSEQDVITNNEDGKTPSTGEVITISARLSDNLTKVEFTPDVDGSSNPILKLTWEAGDKLIVADHAAPTSNAEFELVSGDGTAEAVFSGTLPVGASSYDVSIKHGAVSYNSIMQEADNDTQHLEYIAAKKGVTDIKSITFDEICGVLGITAKLPAGVVETIHSVSVVASESIFNSGKELNFDLSTPGDEGDDDILRLYAPVPATSQGVTAGTTLLIRFNGRYTRFITLGASTITPGKLNEIKVNCSQTDKHAGAPSCDGSNEAKAYLIADGYQLAAINSYASTSATTYFKLIDNIDMTGITHNPINTGITGYTITVDFDGNNKTISKLGTSLFYVFKGSIKDLTLDNCSVSKRGIFAEYCQGTGHTISNVKITNGTVNSSTNNVGSLIGRINNGTGTTATITDCTVSDTNVNGTGPVGGMIGNADAIVEVTGCVISGGTVTATARYSGGLIGSAGNYASTFTDCHVSNITVTSSADRVGGLAGQTEKLTAVNNCSSTNAIVTGTINLGGLLGILYGSATDCTSTGGSITSSNTTSNTDIGLGGLAGWLQYGIISHCSSSVSINQTTNGRDIGGLVGKMVDGTIEKSYATGDVSGIQRNVGGLVGLITLDSGTASISNCYCTGNVTSNSYCGGFLGLQEKGSVLIQNCYASGNISATGGFAAGGMIGVASTADFTMSNSAAWNGSITPKNYGAENWSSGAVVGVTFPKCTLTDNYRNPAMSLTAYWVPAAGFNHPNVNSTHPLTDSDGAEMSDTGTGKGQAHYPQYPYHGKVEAGKTLSQLASTTLGWSGDVWDFTGDLPTLK